MSSKRIYRVGEPAEEVPAPESHLLRGRVSARFLDPRVTASTWLAEAREVLEDARKQAATLLVEAQERADSIVREAQAESAALYEKALEEARMLGYEEGYEEGYEVGYAAGLNAERAEVREQLHTVYQLADEALNAKAAIIAGAEAEILELVIEIARKVIGEVIDLNRNVAIDLVANAIKYAKTADAVTIRVNPRDVESLRDYWAEAVGRNPGHRQWVIIGDRRVKPGGCVIDTEAGSVDAQIDTQLVQIQYAFDRGSVKAREQIS